ncbi:MAG: hypothetical protein PHG16_11930 [Lachnospiraceae bacterium]|nr:hypothetical protein [Lachnospiraceae bacterium]
MLKSDTTKYQLLEFIGICGEFPALSLNRFFTSPSYAEKVITELKRDKLIRTHYKDKLRGYRLTKRAKEMLLSANPDRFTCYLTGNTETNLIRSEVPKRLRLHQKVNTYLTLLHAGVPIFADEKPALFHPVSEAITLQNLPLFYSSREIKELGSVTTKIKNSRSVGILMASHCVYAIYNTGGSVLKWEYKTEVRLNAFLQHYLHEKPYSGPPKIRAIMLGDSMDMAYRLMTSTGGYRKSLFMLDTAFEHFHYLPNNAYGETLLRLLSNPQIIKQLNQLLLSDHVGKKEGFPAVHDAVDTEGRPTLLAYDFDMLRINKFNTGLKVFRHTGNLICFDFQIPCLKEYITADVHFSSIDFHKFRRGFFHET